MSKKDLSKEEKRKLKNLARESAEKEEEIKKSVDVDNKKVTVLCVRFGNKYGREYVERLRNMVSRHLSVPYEFVCLTDDSHPIEGVRSIVQPGNKYRKLWWYKVHMFDRNLSLSGRILYFDLDVVITGNIDRLVTSYTNQFMGIRDFNRKFYNNWKYLNSSVMSWTHGLENFVYDEFSKEPNKAMVLQGDQDWIWKVGKGKIHFWPEDWIKSYKWEIRQREDLIQRDGKRGFKNISNIISPNNCSVMVFHGDPKPQHIMDPIVVENWR